MWDWLDDIVDDISDGIGDAWDWINDTVDDAWDWVDDTVDDVWDWVNDTFNDIVDNVGGGIGDGEEEVEKDIDDKEEEVETPIWYCWDDTEVWADDDEYKVNDGTLSGWEAILEWLKAQGDKVSGANAKALDLLPDPMSWLLGPIGMIIDLLQKNQIINPDIFIEQGLAIYRLQKELAIKITELEKEAATSLPQP
ncbi:unnamed protein product [marine sediment metagenome]|uniref:Uncharacterized protein n=1 Tax=marine sediment metagenome TaxID=412755 RepID=X1TUF9_9ZZZZ